MKYVEPEFDELYLKGRELKLIEKIRNIACSYYTVPRKYDGINSNSISEVVSQLIQYNSFFDTTDGDKYFCHKFLEEVETKYSHEIMSDNDLKS